MENTYAGILLKTLRMKLLLTVVIGTGLLSAIAVDAQQKPKKDVTKLPPPKEVKVNNPLADFKERNKDVKTVRWKQGNVMIIEKKNGLVETYRLNNKTDERKAEDIYGTLPPSPPPPPPPPKIIPPVKHS